jgi:hypothetical protein
MRYSRGAKPGFFEIAVELGADCRLIELLRVGRGGGRLAVICGLMALSDRTCKIGG